MEIGIGRLTDIDTSVCLGHLQPAISLSYGSFATMRIMMETDMLKSLRSKGFRPNPLEFDNLRRLEELVDIPCAGIDHSPTDVRPLEQDSPNESNDS